MNSIARDTIKQDILAVSVAQPGISNYLHFKQQTHPSTWPIIDITANVLEYAILAASHALGSGHVWTNHVWNTEGEYLPSEQAPISARALTSVRSYSQTPRPVSSARLCGSVPAWYADHWSAN